MNAYDDDDRWASSSGADDAVRFAAQIDHYQREKLACRIKSYALLQLVRAHPAIGQCTRCAI